MKVFINDDLVFDGVVNIEITNPCNGYWHDDKPEIMRCEFSDDRNDDGYINLFNLGPYDVIKIRS